MNILWITNKYVEGKSLSRYYPHFLKNVEDKIEQSGNKISFIFFSNAMKPRVKTKNNYFYFPRVISSKKGQKIAKNIENDYKFTFKQAYFPDLIQVSKNQDYRQIHLKEKEFSNLSHLIPKFLYLEKIIQQEKIDAVFCDQSPEVEMEFARTICYKYDKIFLRQSQAFLGRCVFYQQFKFGQEKISLPTLDTSITKKNAKNFVDDFFKKHRSPYQKMIFLPPNLKEFYLSRLWRFYQYPQFIKLAFLKPYYYFEELVLKKAIEDKFDPKKPYLFFGLHLPTEATVTLRSLPYMTQISLIESISRVLPFGHYLYVREHPYHRKHFSAFFLNKLKKLPCVRLISPEIPISEILKNCQGVLTYNSTTGIEALMYGKPVLSFAANVYHGLHQSALYCDNLYQLGEKLTQLINTTVDIEQTYNYIFKMLRSSSKISILAGTFLSKEDSFKKAQIFSNELLLSLKYCKENPKYYM